MLEKEISKLFWKTDIYNFNSFLFIRIILIIVFPTYTEGTTIIILSTILKK